MVLLKMSLSGLDSLQFHFDFAYSQTKRVMSLDVALLLAGAKERGELEERVTKLIKDIIKSGEYMLWASF